MITVNDILSYLDKHSVPITSYMVVDGIDGEIYMVRFKIDEYRFSYRSDTNKISVEYNGESTYLLLTNEDKKYLRKLWLKSKAIEKERQARLDLERWRKISEDLEGVISG